MPTQSRNLILVLTMLVVTGWANAAEMLEEVVVTATKRASNLQDVPISVGVITDEFIDNFDIKDISDIQNFVPGLQVQQTFGSWAVRIRGLGSGITNLAFDSSVPIYIDDVYCGRGKCMESAFLDVQRLEVARGPQGALFGKSTIAGAISSISARPTDEFEAEIRLSTELEYGGYSANGYISGPLSDNVRARLAIKTSDLDGYTENIATVDEDGDQEVNAFRLGIEWDATDVTSFYFKLESGESNTEGRNNQLVSPGLMSLSTTDPNAEYRADDVRSVSTGELEEDFYDYEWNSLTLKMDTELAGHSIMAVAGYWEYKNDWFLDVDGHPEAILNTALEDEYDQTTLELRLLSPADQTIEYIAGIWYQESDLTTRQLSPFHPLFWQAAIGLPIAVGKNIPPLALAFTSGSGMDRNFSRDSEAYSMYGQVTWNVNERLRVIADVRYTDEDQDAVGFAFPLTFPTANTFEPLRVLQSAPGHTAEYLFRQNRSDDSVDPSIKVQYELNDQTMTYVSYAEGSKSGGMKANDGNLGNQMLQRVGDSAYLQQFAGVSAVDADVLRGGLTLQTGNGVFDFEDEEAESWELGLKTTLAGGSVNLNAALFTTEFKNLQTSNYDGTQFIIGNAGSATVDGVEVEVSWQASANLRLHSSISVIDAGYDDFAGAQCVEDASGAPANSDCDPATNTENQKGERLERSPEMEFNLSALWESQLTDTMLIKASASIYHSDDYFVQPTQAAYSQQDSFTKYDARVAVSANDERWEVALTGRNLSDEMVIQHAYNIAGSQFQNLGIGRSYYLEGVVRF
ncbi:MAG: iron complex outermembrane receptor protein [Candidatus Azotimanducaceae bacterium]|jgi:iron complex outermembrane receptor protein